MAWKITLLPPFSNSKSINSLTSTPAEVTVPMTFTTSLAVGWWVVGGWQETGEAGVGHIRTPSITEATADTRAVRSFNNSSSNR